MTISEKNIVKRWEFMSSKDLGYDVNIISLEFAELFKKIFEDECYEFKGQNLTWIKPIIRGFLVNNEGLYENCSVVECLDLDVICLTKEAAAALDWELMNNQYWFERYQYALSI